MREGRRVLKSFVRKGYGLVCKYMQKLDAGVP